MEVAQDEQHNDAQRDCAGDICVVGVGGRAGGDLRDEEGGSAGASADQADDQFFGRAFCNGWFWVGVPLMALSFYLLLVLLSWDRSAW